MLIKTIESSFKMVSKLDI